MPKNRRSAFALPPVFIEHLHDVVVSLEWPDVEPVGPGQLRDRGLLESAAARPFHTAFGEEIYKTIPEKAAALFHSLISNHPFQDGNKRTAVLALYYFLFANSYPPISEPDQMYKLAIETATYRERRLTHDQILFHIVHSIRDAAVPFHALRHSVSVYQHGLGLRRAVRRQIRQIAADLEERQR